MIPEVGKSYWVFRPQFLAYSPDPGPQKRKCVFVQPDRQIWGTENSSIEFNFSDTCTSKFELLVKRKLGVL